MRRRRLLAGSLALAGAAAGARAQQPGRTRRLVVLTPASPVDPATKRRDRGWTAFFAELRRLGHDETANLAVEWRSSEGDSAQIAALAREVAASRANAIFAPDSRIASVLKVEASTIPVVVITVDPIGAGLADSLARPGGNVTGFSIDAGNEGIRKRVELMKQAAPGAGRTALLAPRRIADLPLTGLVRDAIRAGGLTPIDAILDPPVDEASYRRAFAMMAASDVDTVFASSTLEHVPHRSLIAELAIAARLPSSFGFRENAEAGGLMSYGNDIIATFRRAADYVDRIFRGASPADLPFQQPARFELVINLSTAKALGLTLSPVLLAAADEVIE
jgi:putative ABC transport system substrate-binding protein